ncbi:putative transmembrane protein 183BP [Papilio machaon]|uniref:putative transmembrane protein 183BP n=1 Tax=Papilio machaon TaxID=76193 RepID=UPI001E662E9B|nr:putative transmembrane protein 183BP [Papilio machaon]
MPKKKGQNKKGINQAFSDFTLNDCANAPKPVTRVKKTVTTETAISELSWDQIDQDDLDVIEETDADGAKSLVFKKRRNHSRSETEDVANRPGHVYPEIIWYLISWYIKPEDVGSFARINKATYAITKRESFWRSFYKRYCRYHLNLPERLCLENNNKLYGLRQRVIRALYYTYNVFIMRVIQQAVHDSQPHTLVKRRCINVWYCKGSTHWSVYFKFKKMQPKQRVEINKAIDFIEELSRIDANPDEDTQVLQVICQNFYQIPPLMGMTLSSVKVVLSQGFRHRRLHLGFNSGYHNVSKDILPEVSVVLDTVINIYVFDWWHPKYPFFDNQLPQNLMDDKSVPVLKKDFFSL